MSEREASSSPVLFDCNVPNCAPNGALQLWVLEFEVRGVGKGCAMCKASNPEEAGILLMKNGVFNGVPSAYLITRIEQVIVPPCNGLMAEQLVPFNLS